MSEPAPGHSFDLLDWSAVSGLSTALLNLSTTGFDPLWTWNTALFTTDGTVSIMLVPEPSCALLAVLDAIACIQRRRRAISPK